MNTHRSVGSAALGQAEKPELLLSLFYGRETEIAVKGAWGQGFLRVSLPCSTAQGCASVLLIMVGITSRQQLRGPEIPEKRICIPSVSSKIIYISADIIRQAVFCKAAVLWTAEVSSIQNYSHKELSCLASL